MKPTVCLINSVYIPHGSDKECQGNRMHRSPQRASRTNVAQIYPADLSNAICKGMLKQTHQDVVGPFAVATTSSVAFMDLSEVSGRATQLHKDDTFEQAWGDAIARLVGPYRFRQARLEEIEYFRTFGVYSKVPIGERTRVTTPPRSRLWCAVCRTHVFMRLMCDRSMSALQVKIGKVEVNIVAANSSRQCMTRGTRR